MMIRFSYTDGRLTSAVRRAAFSLIEMLVVIGIIGLVAALVVGGAGHFRETSVRGRVQTELKQLENVIDQYHKKYGFYPQSHGSLTPAALPDPARAPLYYELTGVSAPAAVLPYFQVKGIVNELGKEGQDFFPNIGVEGKNYKIVDNATGALGLTVGYPGPDGDVNRWRYVSKNPTNNTESYDLWAEVQVGSKKIVISNWKD